MMLKPVGINVYTKQKVKSNLINKIHIILFIIKIKNNLVI